MTDTVSIGASANDHTGDLLRTAFMKVNTKFVTQEADYNAQIDAILATINYRGDWVTATAYNATTRDYVKQGGLYYLCTVSHTAGVFATDLAALKWVQLDATALFAALASTGVGQGSAMVAHLAAGAGAVATTVQNWLRVDTRVTGFAADGVSGVAVDPTGVVDSTAGLNAAMVQAVAAGLDYVMPAGTFKISGPINIPSNVQINVRGAGKHKTILQCTGTFTTVFSIGDLTAQNIRGEFSDFTIRGVGATVEYGIYGSRVEEHTFRNIRVTGLQTAGVSTGYGYVNSFYNCEFSGNPGDGFKTNADYLGGANNALYFSGCLLFDNTGWGAYVAGGFGVWFDGCTIEQNDKGGTYLRTVRGVKFSGCYFEDNGSVGYSPATPAITIKADIVLNGSSVDTSLSNAFPCDGVVIDGCVLQTTSGNTTFVYNGGANNVSLVGCSSNAAHDIPLYTEQYNQAYKGNTVSIENCGSFATQIVVADAVSATNNEAAAYINVVGPTSSTFGRLAYSDHNFALQDFNQWAVLVGGSATTFARQTAIPFASKPTWQIQSTAAGSSDRYGFSIDADSLPEMEGKLFWWGAWLYAAASDPFPLLYCNQQTANVNPPTTGSWQFRAVSFVWPASGTLSFGVYKSGSNTGNVQIAAPMLMPVGVNLQRAMSTVETTREFMGSAAPTIGTWLRGDVVMNTAPSASGAPGWSCVTAGAPGTWKAMANLAS